MFLRRSAFPLAILLLVACGGDSDVADPSPSPPATPPPPPPPNPLQVERAALVALYHATGGDSWKRRDHWLTSTPVNDWHGLAVHPGSGRIFSMDLRDNGLTGSIPPDIGDFTSLVALNLSGNQLTGSIPPELGKLSRMDNLDLYDNGLTGSIPPDIGDIASLRFLRLSDNQFTGAIPPELGKLSQLENLWLSGNGLNGSIPSGFGKLEHLTALNLSGNQFTGSIPAELGDLALLEVLRLEQNSLSGSIPPEIGGLAALRDLNLGDNDLSGGVPAATGNLQRLRTLSLYDNPGLSGLMPRSLLNLRDLIHFDASHTGLCPPPDPGFRQWLSGLSSVGVPECDVGVVERMALAELFTMTGGEAWENAEGWNTDNDLESWWGVTVEDGAVQTLLLANNGLRGPVPPAIVALTNLEQLDLRNNDLTGSLPVAIGHLSSLTTLRLAGNAGLDGLFPFSMVRMGQLDVLQYEGTGLCIPPTRGFEAWVAGVAVVEGPFCEDVPGVTVEFPMVYLVQSIQQPDGRVPLVANRDALLRVFLTAPTLDDFTAPSVLVTFHREGEQVHQVRIEPSRPRLPVRVDQGNLLESHNAVIPAEHIQPGLEFSVEVDPDGSLLFADDAEVRYPATGSAPLDVVEVPAMDLTVVPVLNAAEPDSSIFQWVSNLTKDSPILSPLRWAFPFSAFEARTRETYVTTVDLTADDGPWRLVLELEGVRRSESGAGYWYGAALSKRGLVRGIAKLGGSVSVGKPLEGELAHEVGHNLTLQHAPCGSAGGVDVTFPYEDGGIGAWGYNFPKGEVISPEARDLMGYCSTEIWLSDYFYEKVLAHRGTSSSETSITSRRAEQLVLSGGVFEGELTLEPPYRLPMASLTPSSSGPYLIEGSSGSDLRFSFRFTPDEDKFGNKYFFFALPVPRGEVDRIVLRGPEGQVVVDERDTRRITIVRDESGLVRGMLRDWEGDVPPVLGQADRLRPVSYRGLKEVRH